MVFQYILLKLAQRCNLACTYCYWFRDKTVYDKPAVLLLDVEDAFVQKLRSHIRQYGLKKFYILFHGGEPTLFGKDRFNTFCTKLRSLEASLDFALTLAITTNGLLVDDEWACLFKKHDIHVTISIDGPQEINDRRRIDFRGLGTYARVVLAIELMRQRGVELGVLAVCDPSSDPKVICDFLVDEMRFGSFDVLVPDATHEDKPTSIATYYRRMFDLWLTDYGERGVTIRYLDNMIHGLLGGESHSESIGYGPTATVTLLTDGSLEPLDVLRVAGNGFTRTCINILTHELQDAQTDPLWQEVVARSLTLAAPCQECAYQYACGGGHIASRWSKERRFDNPSVYCEDIKQILSHIWERLSDGVEIHAQTGERIKLGAALAQIKNQAQT